MNDVRESRFEGFNNESQYFKLRNIGRQFSLGYAIRY